MGDLSTLATCPPNEKFLNMRALLGHGPRSFLCVLTGSVFLPPTMVAVATVYSVAIYSRLVLFSMLLCMIQESIKYAEAVPVYIVQKDDPINSMLGIYVETLNIFMLVVSILPTGGNRKK